jgi:hypothetical protein
VFLSFGGAGGEGKIVVGFLTNFPRFVSQSQIMPVFKSVRLRIGRPTLLHETFLLFNRNPKEFLQVN